MDSVITIPALGDNLIYMYRYNRNDVLVVDPGDSSSVLSALKQRDLNLTTILITHHHWDHIGGTAKLKKKTGCKVISGDSRRIPGIDQATRDKQILEFGNSGIEVITTPGHTSTSVCYYVQPSSANENGILWTGDTLFVGGCGRLFECNAQSMWESLQKLTSLPDSTLVYCGHDYTLENYEFALTVEPGNQAVKKRLSDVLQSGQSVPSTILQEKTTNPFLRAGAPEIKAALKMSRATDAEAFAELRRRKDVF